jgi:hypothetical protein
MTGNAGLSHALLSPQRGQGWRKGGQPNLMNQVFYRLEIFMEGSSIKVNPCYYWRLI